LAAAAPLFATIGSRSFASTVAAVAANKTRTEEVYMQKKWESIELDDDVIILRID
jgi:hypothetical protein